MQYPPVNFRLLRHLLTVARVDSEIAESGTASGYRRRLRQMIAQLDRYAPSEQRDGLRALVELAIEHRSMLNAVDMALDRWTVDAATNQQRESVGSRIKSAINGRKGGRNRAGVSDNKHENWLNAATDMRSRNSHRTAADMARSIADDPDAGAKWDTIARYLRKHGF